MAVWKKSPLHEQQVRLMMWTTPRSVSTAVTKCLSFVQDAQVLCEPFTAAHHVGPDSNFDHTGDTAEAALRETVPGVAETVGFDSSQCTYKWVKEQLEKAHTGKKFIFCKDMAYSVTGHFEFLPKDYKHLFLIRHPLKVFPSWKKVFQLNVGVPLDKYELDKLPEVLFPKNQGYKDMSDLMVYLKEADQEVIVIDTDDLLQDPRGILLALFNVIGLPFEENLLSWEAGNAIAQEWVISKEFLILNQEGHYYKTAFESKCFLKPSGMPNRASLSADLIRCVDAAMPYYKKLYTQRLTPAES
ncbi:branched-chain-amino-acid aminotransferase-like protein 2 [Acanthaster planci]|uniref:Branched-chain-amino-acid aminotransferase-like protein 2 n=1 Tax=Acanthaster planci TaxID=133434 RepID=A0A8B7ZFC9_ACAPL|nr:branched-chain-amino-acid aminotransferase-like protein 2 [Acanthaster planci]